ncbi:hypothetical protein HPB51_027689 [Rhipicephalus microplus]|uniref:Uncharacterized protein n=1 Tax=Rhipicephalus microplus TaxID=6941 RepID=A0A9J6CZJ9_RHIMP|nr:hypothetical protein HPB51_027689 [Rhipicephalus microplus]
MATKYGCPRTTCVHPCDEGRNLHFLADAPPPSEKLAWSSDFFSSKPDLRAELDDVEIPAMFENLEPQEQKLQEYLARWHIRGEKCRDVLVHKHVTFAGCSETTQEQAETSLCRIYCRNVKVDEFFVATESDALAALKKADALFLCPGCGIEPIKTALEQKTKDMDEFSLHGGLVFDELKLSENIALKACGELSGFVDLGDFTEPEDKTSLSDHGLIIMFQPFQASSVQIICKAPHPVDSARHLHMTSDFPHLVKCVRNAFVSKRLQIRQGHVHVSPIKEAWKNDREAITLKVMPHITQAHVERIAFEKMRVNLAYQLFSEEVLKGLFFYKSNLQEKFRIVEPT